MLLQLLTLAKVKNFNQSKSANIAFTALGLAKYSAKVWQSRQRFDY